MLLSAQLIVDVLSLLINPEVQRGGEKKRQFLNISLNCENIIKSIGDLPEVSSLFCCSSNCILHFLFLTGSKVAIPVYPSIF